ncbi:MAG: hypothetical protein Q8S21_00890 [Candidatus Paracaedibacteraceae bacterium]|nr:hypothetical protein [Candidatus Paracaedibacteraceae bacterium]
MKNLFNTLLATAAMVSVVTVANATDSKPAAHGFYLGASAGVANTNVKSKVQAGGTFYNLNTSNGNLVATTDSAESRLVNTDAGKAAGIFGLMAGYNFQKGSTVFGGEIYGGFDSSTVKVYDDKGSGSSVEGGLWTSTVKRKSFFGFAPRIGFMLTPSTQLYARLGIEYGKWTAAVNPNTTSLVLANNVTNVNAASGNANAGAAAIAASSLATTASKKKLSFAPGVGMEVYMGKMFVRGEYAYLMGPKITLVQNTNGYSYNMYNGSTATHTFKTSQHRVQLAVGFKF